MRSRVHGPVRPNPYYDAAADLWCYDTSRPTDEQAAKNEAETERYARDVAEQYYRWGTSE